MRHLTGQHGHALGVQQGRVGDGRGIGAGQLAQAQNHLGIQAGDVGGQLVRMEFFAHHLDRADQGAAGQGAQVLKHAEHDDEADDVARPLLQHLADADQQGRADEHGRGEGDHGLADIQLGRTGQNGGVAVDEGADGDEAQGDGDGLVQLGHVQGQGADRRAGDHGQQDQQEEAVQLVRTQADHGQEAHGARGLFRQGDADQQDGAEQA
ncbi:hypothetical protein BREV_BREV_02658 [Brevundimonas mediterranea]|uniref:Uncharacterized protein n=1 Tax=Brevundimonas mediterranea TaxID=74329 RepID=A0A7Z8Y5F7_9CAUL|nr:hypothetical protein BREV_BREV_02658 [Brevundimonas mediterranea]